MTETVTAEPLPAGGYIPPPPPTSVAAGDAEPARDPWVRPWALRFAGATLTDQEVTGGHLAIVTALQQRDDWSDLSPWAGPVRLCVWIQAMLIAKGVSVESAAAAIATAKAADLIGALADRRG